MKNGDNSVPDIPATAEWQLPPDEWARVDRACDRFEKAWQAGQPPALTAIVEDVDSPAGQILLCELLKIELAYRSRRGEQPTEEEYQAIFPKHANLIAAAFGPAATKPMPEPEIQLSTSPGGTDSPPAVSTRSPGDAGAGGPEEHWPSIPGYDIVSEIGRGAMGIVYKAWQQRAKRHVALKVIRDGFLAGPEHRRRFKIEAEAAAQFQHPNLIRIYEVGEHKGLMYFSMELGEGGSLDKVLAGKPIPARDAATIARTLAEAVHYAHEKQVIHRDLKPGNIVLTLDARPMITDFGLAKRLDSETVHTPSLAVMGTASYMPPEQAKGQSKEVSFTADVYSLGAILYEMLTGHPPFKAANFAATVQLVINQEPLPLKYVQVAVPGDLETICLMCLEKDPSLRYPRADALAEDLRRFLADEPLPGAGSPEWDRWCRWARRAGYELEREVGRGLLGIVFKARHVEMDRIVALKVIHRDVYERYFVHARRFRYETIRLARLVHPNIVSILDVAEQDQHHYFTMPFVDGGNLDTRILGRLPPFDVVAQLVMTVAQALHYAHQEGIVHGDLKPANVLINRDGIPMLTDFQLAAYVAGSVGETETEAALHARTYLAPEHLGGASRTWADQPAKPRQPLSPAADVFGLGSVLYELLTGRSPFQGETAQETLQRLRLHDPRTPSSFQPDVPSSLERICLNCLEKDPQNRYASAEDLAIDLARFLGISHVPSKGGQSPNTVLTGYRAFVKPKGEDLPTIPDYEIMEELGRSSVSIVYKARMTDSNRVVALKILDPQWGYGNKLLARLRATAEAMARFSHLNLVSVYRIGEHEGMLLLVLELVEGGRLDNKPMGQEFPVSDAARLVCTLADAMYFVHQKGIVHGNLKPSKVLFTKDGTPKITNFLGLRDEDEYEQFLSRIEAPGGTAMPRYMAPEQLSGNISAIGPATDLYALGLILYQTLTGWLPFRGATLWELLAEVQRKDPALPSQFRLEVPPDLDAICLRCLAKEPNQRYPTAAELAKDLRQFLAGTQLTASPLGGLDPSVHGIREIADPPGRDAGNSSPAGVWARLVRWVTRRQPM
jgi:serine/threonine protein kinase